MRSLVIERIESEGPLPFDAFMEMCLYDPDHGYFSAGAVRPGERGDFVTAPEVSPHFGGCIANWVNAQLLDSPSGWAVIEVGAGSGALLRPLAERLPDDVPVYAVERSRAARAALAGSSVATVVEDIGEVRESKAVVVMNEVVDNIPAALVKRSSDGWDEMTVGADGGQLVLVDRPARASTVEWAERHLSDAPVGKLVVAQVGMTQYLTALLDRFDASALCVIDYGGPSTHLFTRPDETLVRTYRHQRTGFDFLTHPGETDITVDMNTDVVVSALTDAGASAEAQSQRDFLNSWGAVELLESLVDAEHAEAAAGDVMGQLTARSDAVAVRALTDDQGFGTFRVVTASREPDNRV